MTPVEFVYKENLSHGAADDCQIDSQEQQCKTRPHHLIQDFHRKRWGPNVKPVVVANKAYIEDARKWLDTAVKTGVGELALPKVGVLHWLESELITVSQIHPLR